VYDLDTDTAISDVACVPLPSRQRRGHTSAGGPGTLFDTEGLAGDCSDRQARSAYALRPASTGNPATGPAGLPSPVARLAASRGGTRKSKRHGPGSQADPRLPSRGLNGWWTGRPGGSTSRTRSPAGSFRPCGRACAKCADGGRTSSSLPARRGRASLWQQPYQSSAGCRWSQTSGTRGTAPRGTIFLTGRTARSAVGSKPKSCAAQGE